MASKNEEPPSIPSTTTDQDEQRSYSLSTRSLHADDPLNSYTDVAPALHVSTTYRYNDDPEKLKSVHTGRAPRLPGGVVRGDHYVYSREIAPNSSRLEMLLTSIIGVPCLSYSSGLAAFHAMIVYLHPKVVAIGDGYHGTHGTLELYQKLTGCKIVNLFDQSSWEGEGWKLGQGDVVHVETPVNPTGMAYNIQHYADLAHARGAVLTVDSTFAPPPLQDPFKQGADFVMHSATKYLGGHSDLLCGIIGVGKNTPDWEQHYWGMFAQRLSLGSTVGNMEGWLGVRSLRTLALRVTCQSESAEKLVRFIHESITGVDTSPDAIAVKAVLASVQHASLQQDDMSWLKLQMPGGFGPVFLLSATSAELAKRFPSKLELFHHATSLGGVESLIEWRNMTDPSVSHTALRVSIGIEAWEDLRSDIVAACRALNA